MQTREAWRSAPTVALGHHDAETASDAVGRRGLVTGLGGATLLAATALAGCALLIIVGASLSICWMIHPAVFVVEVLGLGWGVVRMAGRLVSARPRGR